MACQSFPGFPKDSQVSRKEEEIVISQTKSENHQEGTLRDERDG